MAMMRIKNVFISDVQPAVKDGLWLKAVDGGVSVYLIEAGSVKPLKLVDDMGTPTPDDDKKKDIIRVTDIKALTNKQCNALNVGDQVLKKTGTQTHLYTVTYKDDTNGGLCLSYIDAENAETVAYDREGNNWSWTDTTITPLRED